MLGGKVKSTSAGKIFLKFFKDFLTKIPHFKPKTLRQQKSNYTEICKYSITIEVSSALWQSALTMFSAVGESAKKEVTVHFFLQKMMMILPQTKGVRGRKRGEEEGFV